MTTDTFIDKYDVRVDELEGFTRIQVREDEGQEFYQELIEYVKNFESEIVIANGVIGKASREDFLQGEEIIGKILDEIQPIWTKKQIVAYVHYKIGELVSYFPDFNYSGRFVDSENAKDTRNIWESLVNGKSVCNGIVSISRNILSRAGVSTRELSSGTHTFLLAETEDGNIITDPTWDLKNTLYGSRPRYFGKTYEQLREQDGPFSKAHKLEHIPEDVIEVKDEELREIYYTLGYTKEDRTFVFPILDRLYEIKNNTYANTNERVQAFFNMFMTEFPKEATHLSETSTILESCLRELGVDSKNLTTKFIYQKEDNDCRNPYLCLSINDEEQRKGHMYCMDLEIMQFKDMSAIELDNKFKLHDLDIVKPFWEKYLTQDEREIDEAKEEHIVEGEQSNGNMLLNELKKFKQKQAEIVKIDNATKGLQELAQDHEIEIDKGDKDF